MPKVVLSYSKYHFDPERTGMTGSAGYISKKLWQYLSEIYPNHDLIFLDYTEYEKAKDLKNVDMYLGITENFGKFRKNLKPQQSVLWSVNKSGRARQEIYNTAKRFHLPYKALSVEDGVVSHIKEGLNADYTVCLGGWGNYYSYVQSGVNPNRVYPIGVGYTEGTPYRSLRSGQHIIMFVGTLSFRKGINFIPPILENLKQNNSSIMLKLIGTTVNEYWQNVLANLAEEYKENFLWINEFLDVNGKQFDAILESCAFGIFPSFEEGIAGAAIQVIQGGVPLLYSSETGLEFTENSYRLTTDSKIEWLNAISDILGKGVDFRKNLLFEQQQLLESNGSGLPQIKKVLSRISRGSLWPKTRDFSEGIHSKVVSSDNNFEFITSRVSDFPTDTKTSELVFYGPSPLNPEELKRFGILTLDKYTRLNRLVVKNSVNDDAFLISNLFEVEPSFNDIVHLNLSILNSPTKSDRSLNLLLLRQFYWKLSKLLRYNVSKICVLFGES